MNHLFIEPGSHWENGYVESFNGKLRDELLNREIFTTLHEAKVSTATQLAGLPATSSQGKIATKHYFEYGTLMWGRSICFAIEHENKVAIIESELSNFVASTYPLNILVTYVGSTEARGSWIFDKPQYQNYFRNLQGRLLVVIDDDMNLLYDLSFHKRGQPLHWSFFFLNACGQWETL